MEVRRMCSVFVLLINAMLSTIYVPGRGYRWRPEATHLVVVGVIAIGSVLRLCIACGRVSNNSLPGERDDLSGTPSSCAAMMGKWFWYAQLVSVSMKDGI